MTKLISAIAGVKALNGGVTQLVEYPVHTRYVTCSNQVAATRPVGQAVKTPPFHGGNMGSIPVRVTKKERSNRFVLFFIQAAGLVYHRRTKCGVYHQPLWGCISSRVSVYFPAA